MKYYRIMEYVDNGVGANFYYVDENKKNEITKDLKNHYKITEINKDEYNQEQKRIEDKNYYLATGYNRRL